MTSRSTASDALHASELQPAVERHAPAGQSGVRQEAAITVSALGKCYHIYERPADRLKQALFRWKKQFYRDFWAVNDASFAVRTGETVGIIGRNGSGKSTVLQLIAGVLAPTTGRIEIRGRIAALLELGAGFNNEFTGRENVYMAGAIAGFTSAGVDAIFSRVEQFADIGQFIDQPMKTYSSGMYVRLAFACAVMMKPDILIVDEALAVGDIFFQQKCMRYMRDELRGVTKLVVTHDMASIASLCDRCLVMHKGRLVFDGPPAKAVEFYTKLVHNEEFGHLVRSPEPAIEAVARGQAASPHGAHPEHAWVPVDVWHEVMPESRGGAGEVVIERVAFTDRLGGLLETIRPGDRYVGWFVIRSVCPKRSMIFGVGVVDRTGTQIFGDNSMSPPGGPVDLPRAGRYLIRLEFEWPRLQPGSYTITFGCGEGTDPLHHVIQCWAHNVVAVTAISPDLPIHGVFTNPLRDFEVTPLESVGVESEQAQGDAVVDRSAGL